MKMERVVVTGGAGFIGSYVVEELLSRNCGVLVIDNLSAGVIEHVPSGATLEIVDLTAPMACLQLENVLGDFDPTHVIDLAASPYIPDSYASFDWSIQTLQANIFIVVGMAKLMRPFISKLQKYLYVSTSEVYGTAISKEKMDESHRLHPQSTYATSKLTCERLLLNWHKEHNLPVAVIRQFNTFGPRSTHPYVIPEIISQLTHGDGTLFLGNINARRDFTYVSNAAKILVEAVFSPNIQPGEVYNSGAGVNYSVQEIVDLTADLMGLPAPNIDIMDYKLRPDDVDALLCNNAKLQTALGGLKFKKFKDGLTDTIKYYDYKGKWLWED